MKYFVVISLLIVAAGCDSPPAQESQPEPPVEKEPSDQEEFMADEPIQLPELLTYGALRQINLHDDYSSATTVGEVREKGAVPNHGVGALGELSGEITLWGDELYLAHAGEPVQFESVAFAAADEELEATLFFAAAVDEWEEIEPFGAADLAAMEEGLANWRDDHELEGAIPFRIIDPRATVEWHVVDADLLPEEGASSCGERKEYAHQFKEDDEPVRLVGLFTTDHTGVVVDHTTSLHVHVITDDGRSGHVDEVRLSDEAVIEIGRSWLL